MFSTFDLRLLLYVIRLAGWLKHCNLSLSLSMHNVDDGDDCAENHAATMQMRTCSGALPL